MLLPGPEAQPLATYFIGQAAFIALFRYKVPIIPVIDACAAAGLVLTLSKLI